jgi:hypothetical protein
LKLQNGIKLTKLRHPSALAPLAHHSTCSDARLPWRSCYARKNSSTEHSLLHSENKFTIPMKTKLMYYFFKNLLLRKYHQSCWLQM